MNEWNDSLSGDYLWSNVNFGEAVSQVMTPLTWSVIQFTLDDWVFLPGMPTVGVIAGRPYLNISIFMTLYKAMRRSQADLLRYMESTLYMRLPEGVEIPTISVSPTALSHGFLLSARIRWKQWWGVKNLTAYITTNNTWFARIRQAIHLSTSGADLLRLWHTGMKRHIKDGRWCVLGSATHSADYTLALRRQLEALVGPQDANVLIANLSQGQAALESLGPLLGLAKLARGELSRADYLTAYGHRGPDEFELSIPRPAEDPTWLEQILLQFTTSPLDLEAMLAEQQQAFTAALSRLHELAPGSARHLGQQIAESARRARLRELARSAYTRDRWAIRLFALRAAELTGLGDQVFFLTLPELLALLSADRAIVSRIESRQAAYRQYKTLPPPPAIIRGPFDPFVWAEDPIRPTDIYIAHQVVLAQPASARIEGSPGSAGVVEGFVRVIAHPEHGDQLQPGEILVASQTDIAWTLLFPRAAAVITDIGAPLSHAAIVARELGIPAVVGCGNATARLHTGDRVRVDGGQGIVEILARG